MPKRIYLSGPMTGLPELNYPAFRAAASHLRGMDFVEDVHNPAEWEEKNNDGVFDLKMAFVDYCLYIIREADAVVVLPGWEASPGANAEVALAKAIGKPVFAYSRQTGYASLHLTDPDHPRLFTEHPS